MICVAAWLTAPPALAAQSCGDRRRVAGDVAGCAVGGRREECAERDAGDDSPPVVVDLVGESGRAGEVDAGHALERNRDAVRSDQAVPADQHALLPEADGRVVGCDQAASPGG